jgi:16S rRNA processing protein RimM
VASEILTDFPERLTSLKKVWLAGSNPRIPPRETRVVSCRLHIGQALFLFEGVSSIDDAEKLRGLEVQIPLSERTALPPDRHYISELIGCAVWERDAEAALGTVRAVQALAGSRAPESWVLAVATPQGGEVLIPFAAEICVRVDIVARRIDVQLPPGLLELYS